MQLHVTLSASYSSSKGKAIPLQFWTSPQAIRSLRLPEFLRIWHVKVVRLSALHRPPSAPKRYPWYLYLLEAEQTPGPWCSQKIQANKKSQMFPLGTEPATSGFQRSALTNRTTTYPHVTVLVDVDVCQQMQLLRVANDVLVEFIHHYIHG